MWSAKAKLHLAMKFLRPTLLASFKDSLPANEQVELDQNKPDELAKEQVQGNESSCDESVNCHDVRE